MDKKRCTAIVLAAGSGSRMKSGVAKQFIKLQGRPLIWYALQAMEESSVVDDCVLVTGAGDISYVQEEIVTKYGFRKVAAVVAGGAERYDSVYRALRFIADGGLKVPNRDGYVFIHDGARPFLTEEILQRCYEQVCGCRACVAAMPVKDTVKIADRDDFAIQTPDRSTLWQIQTPQVFETQLITEAYEKMMARQKKADLCQTGVLPQKADKSGKILSPLQITDDAMAVEAFTDVPVKLVRGSYENIKITTPEDMAAAEALLRRRSARAQKAAIVFLICGKICSGKSTYAERLRAEYNAVLLSVDEIMLAIFGLYAGENHDEYTEKIQNYLFEKSVEIVRSGHHVILDWGFWTKRRRSAAREYYQSRNIACEFHYIDISDSVWEERIERRNQMVSEKKVEAYLIDDNLSKKFEGLFEPPTDGEIDVYVRD